VTRVSDLKPEDYSAVLGETIDATNVAIAAKANASLV
jgi:hypothetical protein